MIIDYREKIREIQGKLLDTGRLDFKENLRLVRLQQWSYTEDWR